MPSFNRRRTSASPKGAAGSTGLPIYASSFSVAISPSSNTVGGNVIVTVTPAGGLWPSSQSVVGNYSGPGGSFSSASVVAESSAAVSLKFATLTVGSGKLNATVPGLISLGGQDYIAVTQPSIGVPLVFSDFTPGQFSDGSTITFSS